MTNSLYFVDPKSKEWELMWDKLSNHPLNDGDRYCECFFTGESWQYMGSHRNNIGCWIHSFRHRNHPKTNHREVVTVIASDYF